MQVLDISDKPKVVDQRRHASQELILDLIAISRRTQLRFNWRPNLADETDNKFIEAAISATAIIITYNIVDFAHGDIAKYGWDVMTPLDFITRFDLENN